jgi:hypothetical protein
MTPSPQPLLATLVVHVYSLRTVGVRSCAAVPEPSESGVEYECADNVLRLKRWEETWPLRVTRRTSGEWSLGSLETSEHTIHVVPGLYEIAPTSGYPNTTLGNVARAQQVTVGEGRTVELTFVILSE